MTDSWPDSVTFKTRESTGEWREVTARFSDVVCLVGQSANISTVVDVNGLSWKVEVERVDDAGRRPMSITKKITRSVTLTATNEGSGSLEVTERVDGRIAVVVEAERDFLTDDYPFFFDSREDAIDFAHALLELLG